IIDSRCKLSLEHDAVRWPGGAADANCSETEWPAQTFQVSARCCGLKAKEFTNDVVGKTLLARGGSGHGRLLSLAGACPDRHDGSACPDERPSRCQACRTGGLPRLLLPALLWLLQALLPPLRLLSRLL